MRARLIPKIGKLLIFIGRVPRCNFEESSSSRGDHDSLAIVLKIPLCPRMLSASDCVLSSSEISHRASSIDKPLYPAQLSKLLRSLIASSLFHSFSFSITFLRSEPVFCDQHG